MTKTKMSPFFIDFAFKSEKKPCGKPSQVGYECCQLLWRHPRRHSIAATDFPLALLVWNSMTPRPRMAQVYHYVHSTLTTCLWHLAAISWNALIHAFVTRQFSMYLYAVVSHGHKFIIIVESLFLRQSNHAKFRGASSWSNDALLTKAPHQLALKLPSALRLCTKVFSCCPYFYRHYRQTTGMYKWSARWLILNFEEPWQWNSQALFSWVDVSSKAINEVCVRQNSHSGWGYKLNVIA